MRDALDAIESQFVGTWELRGMAVRTEDGQDSPVWGKSPVGRLVYDSHGQMFALLMPAARNQANGRRIPEALQREAAGYYGTYAIDKVRRIVTHRVIASLRSTESGTLERAYSLEGDRLTLAACANRDGAPVTYTLTWERMRYS